MNYLSEWNVGKCFIIKGFCGCDYASKSTERRSVSDGAVMCEGGG